MVHVCIKTNTFKSLMEYLTDHELDIANDINDMGRLKGLYLDILGTVARMDEKDPPLPPDQPPIRYIKGQA